MRALAVLVAVLIGPGLLTARPLDAAAGKRQTVDYVLSLQQPDGGFAPSIPAEGAKAASSLRATSAAARTLKYLTGKPAREAVPHADQAAAFVLSCYDPKTGGFADTPGGKPDVVLTSVGVMAAVEFEITKGKFAGAMDYLKQNARTFEDVRLGAAAVEAWGVKDCPFDLRPWVATAASHVDGRVLDVKDGGAREIASWLAFKLRLGEGRGAVDAGVLNAGQLADGGWKKADAKGSDLETCYRVMRAYHLLHERPADVKTLQAFLTACRNKDGGYSVKPGEPSTISGAYYAAIITYWLDKSAR